MKSLFKNFLFVLHTLLSFAFFFPFIFSWWIILIFYILWYIHLFVFGKCVLSIIEYGKDNNKTFGQEFLKVFKINMPQKYFDFYVRYLMVPLCLSIAVIWQEVLGFKPLLI